MEVEGGEGIEREWGCLPKRGEVWAIFGAAPFMARNPEEALARMHR